MSNIQVTHFAILLKPVVRYALRNVPETQQVTNTPESGGGDWLEVVEVSVLPPAATSVVAVVRNNGLRALQTVAM